MFHNEWWHIHARMLKFKRKNILHFWQSNNFVWKYIVAESPVPGPAGYYQVAICHVGTQWLVVGCFHDIVNPGYPYSYLLSPLSFSLKQCKSTLCLTSLLARALFFLRSLWHQLKNVQVKEALFTKWAKHLWSLLLNVRPANCYWAMPTERELS